MATNTNFRQNAIVTAVKCEAAMDLNAFSATLLWGLTQPTDQELATFWAVDKECKTDRVAKRVSRAKKARETFAKALSVDPERFETLIKAYEAGAPVKSLVATMEGIAAVSSHIVINTAAHLLEWLDAVAAQTVVDGRICELRSIKEILAERKASKKATKNPQASTATTASGKQSNGDARVDLTPASDDVDSDDGYQYAAEAAADTDGMLEAIQAAVAEAMAAPDAASATALMAKAWAASTGVTLPQ
jgi:hypothetical protein